MRRHPITKHLVEDRQASYRWFVKSESPFMPVLIAEPDLRLRSLMFTTLNDAGLWPVGVALNGGGRKLPPILRREPYALVAECGTPGDLVAALRARWPRMGVIYTAAPGASTPQLHKRDGVLPRPVVLEDLVKRVRALA